MSRARRVGYLNKRFEFDVRNIDPCIGGQLWLGTSTGHTRQSCPPMPGGGQLCLVWEPRPCSGGQLCLVWGPRPRQRDVFHRFGWEPRPQPGVGQPNFQPQNRANLLARTLLHALSCMHYARPCHATQQLVSPVGGPQFKGSRKGRRRWPRAVAARKKCASAAHGGSKARRRQGGKWRRQQPSPCCSFHWGKHAPRKKHL
jgi:hypothetical protein